MNEFEIQKQSLSIKDIADNLMICDEESLKTTFEIIKAIRKPEKCKGIS